MTNISIVDYVKIKLTGRLSNVLEIGSGNQSEAVQISTEISGEYFSIDKKAFNAPTNSKIVFINADYFNIDEVDRVIHNKKFDLIFSNYSLCFNKKDTIVKYLPYYFDKLTPGGIFYVGDFTNDEQVVKKRTNLDDEWFFNIIKMYFGLFKISRQDIYENEHGHSHSVLELIAHK